MEALAAVLTIALVTFTFAVLVREFLREGWIRQLRAAAVNERNRNRFGELRTELMALARDGAIDVRSEPFSIMYAMLTTLMRNPHDYDRAVTGIMGLRPDVNARVRSELSATEARLMLKLAHSLDAMCCDYSRIYRALAWFYGPVSESPRKAPLWVATYALRSEKMRKLARVGEARRTLEEWGNAALA